ncbi:ImmA/IrrE family metallo-endopeptidase [Celeribacter sp.]|uniref:ImmA/IrrE family metallo-endopeptidase n=1 Tax=Pseudomonadati TaxID=3379134 RepID=UPI003A94479B
MTGEKQSIKEFIESLVRSTGAASPEEAIRLKAREHIVFYEQNFGEPEIPIDVMMLASLKGIRPSDSMPVLSPDAEIGPDGQGGVEMRVNPDRPETRKRFSIAHEISHTFFPDYEKKEWCRTDARYRDLSDPSQHLEMLCDIGASELLFPERSFTAHAAEVSDADGFTQLALTYQASREATLRRYVELASTPVAVVFFSWKLKPTQKGIIGNENQGNLFGISAEEELRTAMQLRVDYAIYSPEMKQLGLYFPPNKSVDRKNPVLQSSANWSCVDVPKAHFDFGQASGDYSVNAIPLPTDDSARGPEGECSVAAILRPVRVDWSKAKRRTKWNQTESLF